ncbi:exo-1,3-beta-D-glucanase [Tricladium varicosporioides]|nr:exo-1,3-beta-D-glucanase [Hymenoscyphus varicosporioides]
MLVLIAKGIEIGVQVWQGAIIAGAIFIGGIVGGVGSVGTVGNAPGNVREVLQERSGIDIASFIDDFVYTWIQKHSENNPSQASIASVHATAARVKNAILNGDYGTSSTPISNGTTLIRKSTGQRIQRQINNLTMAANSTLDAMRAVVRLAQKEANQRNVERIKNPRRNHYYSNDTSNAALKARAEDIQLYSVNTTIAAAAAAVAEADAAVSNGLPKQDYNIPSKFVKSQNLKRGEPIYEHLEKRAGNFWMQDIPHVGKIPYGGVENNGYSVYRNVKDYGAVGDGKTDDTAAINKAMSEGNRCGANCGSSSVKGAIVYFPSGTYLISSPILSYYHTQMVGDANNRPVLMAAPSFIGLGLISSDVYTGGNGGQEEWFINQSNFLRQIRNFVIDLTNANMVDIAGIHWQVAQATSIQQVYLFQSKAADKSHMGIFAENGSGGFMSDVGFIGGAIGIRCGNQQFTTRNFLFLDCKTAIDMIWDWGWTWKSLWISGSDYGIKLTGTDFGGSLQVLDSLMISTTVGIYITTPLGDAISQRTSVNIDNLVLDKVGTAVSAPGGITLAGGSQTIVSWTLGQVYDAKHPSGIYQPGNTLSSIHPKTASLMGGPNGGYLERSKPQYADLSANSFISARLATSGDGSTDDTFGLNLILSMAKDLNRPLYIPMGSYVVTDTIHIPVGSRVVGECWSQIVAQGANFQDASNPHVMVQVGLKGDAGVIEIQDLMFTNRGPTAGVILMEWNVRQTAAGSAAMWDSHFRIGGAKGSGLQAGDCPKLTRSINPKCIAGTMMLHLTTTSSAYLENVWAWVADHDLDSGLDQTQIDIYVARGILIESQGPSWFYGTASEHAVLYQYQLFGARDIFMGMIQTESPYYLPKPQAPSPFTSTVGLFHGDPTFSDCSSSTTHCAAAWGLRIVSSTNIHISGAGLYNWFQDYVQPCVDTQDCQQRVVQILGSTGLFLYNLYTIGTVEMINGRSGKGILAKDNTNQISHPFTSIINAWLISSDNSGDGGPEDDTPVRHPDCTAIYDTIDQIVASAASIPPECMDKYLARVEIKLLNDSLNKYDKTIADGYDAKFKIYVGHIKELVPLQLSAYMAGAQLSGFFTCKTSAWVTCCSECQSAGGCPPNCDGSKGCISGIRTTTVSCPTVIPNPSNQEGNLHAIDYTCTNMEGFFADILKKYGIEKSWIVFGKFLARTNAGCWMNSDPLCGEKTNTYWTGFPIPGVINVTDPKILISVDKIKTLSTQLGAKASYMDYSLADLQNSDLVDAASIPALLTAAAVASMSNVIEVANQISADNRKTFILAFVMAVLMLVPGIGEVAGAAEMAGLKVIINLLGDAGNAALAIYSTVEDPKSAVFAMFGLLLGGTGQGSAKAFKDAAAKRRSLTTKEIETLGPIKPQLEKINTLRTSCLK